MRLKLFDLVDDTVDLLEQERPLYEQVAERLKEYLRGALATRRECLMELQSRVKGAASLREKMLRKSLYKRADTGRGVLDGLSDLVGVRVQCRFISEEAEVYRALCDYAWKRGQDGLFFHPELPEVALELGGPQPQRQKNGFSIYRIDGVYLLGERRVRFELQIKALVHVFWAEVEHEIIYKNNSYLLMDKFMGEMLTSTYESLALVDSQLHLIYRQMQAQIGGGMGQLRSGMMTSVLAKVIADIFILKMKNSLGFTLNFKAGCDVLSRYLLLHYQDRPMDGSLFADIMAHLNAIALAPIDFTEPIELEAPYESSEPFCQILADYWLGCLNTDYEWNLFFRMLFALQPGGNLDDFSDFVHMLRDRFSDELLYRPLRGRWRAERLEALREEVMRRLAQTMVRRGDTGMMSEQYLDQLEDRIREAVRALAQHPEPVEPPAGLINGLFEGL